MERLKIDCSDELPDRKFLERSAKEYERRLLNKCFLVVYGKGENLDTVEVEFRSNNWLHLMGFRTKPQEDNPGFSRSTQAFRAAVKGKLDVDNIIPTGNGYSAAKLKASVAGAMFAWSTNIDTVSEKRNLRKENVVLSSVGESMSIVADKRREGALMPVSLIHVAPEDADSVLYGSQPVVAVFHKRSNSWQPTKMYNHVDQLDSRYSVRSNKALAKIVREQVDTNKIAASDFARQQLELPDAKTTTKPLQEARERLVERALEFGPFVVPDRHGRFIGKKSAATALYTYGRDYINPNVKVGGEWENVIATGMTIFSLDVAGWDEADIKEFVKSNKALSKDIALCRHAFKTLGADFASLDAERDALHQLIHDERG